MNGGGIVPPVFLHLDPGLQVHLCAHKFFHIMPGQSGHFFHHGAALADDDPLMALLFAVDGGLHLDNLVVPLGKAGDLYGRAMGNFLIQTQQQL